MTKEVKIKIVPKNFETYKNCGYDIKMGEEIILKIEDLPINSRKIVKVECDNCGKEKEMKYNDYVKVFNKKQKYYCSDCRIESIKQGFQDKYGVDNCFQSEEIKSKIRKTTFEKYGVEHHLQNKDILEKLKKTNQRLYGVDFIPLLKKHTTENYIKLCEKIHNNLYSYENANYTGMEQKIEINCKKHGTFWQRAVDHYRGLGCPKCKTSKGENFIIEYLNEHNITYQFQKTFEGCKYKNKLPFDFYIPSMNLCIEYDGFQHFEAVESWGGEDELKLRRKKDRIKNNFCKKNGILLKRIKFSDDVEMKLVEIFA